MKEERGKAQQNKNKYKGYGSDTIKYADRRPGESRFLQFTTCSYHNEQHHTIIRARDMIGLKGTGTLANVAISHLET
jgi:hypothetical protein